MPRASATSPLSHEPHLGLGREAEIMAFATADRETQGELAYRRLKAMIMDGALPPHMQLLEQEAAARIGVSRTPVREAMVRLQAEGLVEIRPRHGMRVLPVSATDMAEIYGVLSSLEATAAETVARRGVSAATLAMLKSAVRDMDVALEGGDLAGWAQGDELFHRSLVEECGNRRLIGVIELFWAQSHRARLLTLRLRPKPTDSNREHEALVRAIEAGDGETARRVHQVHRDRAGTLLVALLADLASILVGN